MKPETPLLAAKLPLHRIAVLIEGFQISEDPDDLLAGNSKRVAILGPFCYVGN